MVDIERKILVVNEGTSHHDTCHQIQPWLDPR